MWVRFPPGTEAEIEPVRLIRSRTRSPLRGQGLCRAMPARSIPAGDGRRKSNAGSIDSLARVAHLGGPRVYVAPCLRAPFPPGTEAGRGMNSEARKPGTESGSIDSLARLAHPCGAKGHSIKERGRNSALKRGKELIVAGDVTVAKPALRPSRRNQPAWALKGGLARLHSRLARQVCPGRPVPACRQSMQHTSSPIQPTAHWPRRDPPPDAQNSRQLA